YTPPTPPAPPPLSLHDALPICVVAAPRRRRAPAPRPRPPRASSRYSGAPLWGAQLASDVVQSADRLGLHSRAKHSGKPHGRQGRSEEHTSELQSRFDLVCRLLL